MRQRESGRESGGSGRILSDRIRQRGDASFLCGGGCDALPGRRQFPGGGSGSQAAECAGAVAAFGQSRRSDSERRSFTEKGYSYTLEQEKLSPERILAAVEEVYRNRDRYRQAMDRDQQESGTQRVLEVIEEAMASK